MSYYDCTLYDGYLLIRFPLTWVGRDDMHNIPDAWQLTVPSTQGPCRLNAPSIFFKSAIVLPNSCKVKTPPTPKVSVWDERGMASSQVYRIPWPSKRQLNNS